MNVDIRRVADIRRGVEQAALRGAEAVFQLAADCEHLRPADIAQHHRQRRKAARAPDHIRPAVHPVADRIVRADADFPVVREHDVAEAADLADGIVVAAADRRAAGIAARHNKAVGHRNAVGIIEQQHLHRRVRQHDADRFVVRRDFRADAHAFALLQQHDRLLPACEIRLLPFLHGAFAPHGIQVAHHQRKGLHRAFFQRAQPADGRGILRVAAKVKAADALDCGDLALCERAPDCGDRLPAAQLRPDDVNLRAAGIAADGLRVIAAGRRVAVFRRAFRAHREGRHARAAPVVGHPVENRQPRTALRAVDERVQTAAVLRIKQLCTAAFTGRDIGRNKDVAALVLALNDRKCVENRVFVRPAVRLLRIENDGTLRRMLPQICGETVDRFRIALRNDLDIAALVRDRPADAEALRRNCRERPESQALHNAENPYQPLHGK